MEGLAMNANRVLVTGHEGYIGTVLVPMLVRAGMDVTGLDSGLFRECAIGPMPQVRAMAKDIRDVEESDVAGFDAIIHLAGLSNDPLGNMDPDLTAEINHTATVRFAEMAKAVGVRRFLFASTCAVYGPGGDSLLDEDSKIDPLTPYAKAKASAERDLDGLADDRFAPVHLRAGTAYGVSAMLRFDLVVNNLVAWATDTGRVFIKSDGRSWRPMVHIEDIARGYLALLEAPFDDVAGRAFNVGRTEENYTVRQVAGIVADVVTGATVEFAADAWADKLNYKADCTRLGQIAGYAPDWDVARGAQQLFETIRQKGFRTDDFEGSRYKRQGHLERLIADGRVDETFRWVARADKGASDALAVATA